MDVEPDDAASQLGGLALGQVLEDLGVVSGDSDLSRIGLGGSSSSAAHVLKRDEIYRQDFDDDADDLADDEAAADEDDGKAVHLAAPQSVRLLRDGTKLVRGEDDDFADE